MKQIILGLLLLLAAVPSAAEELTPKALLEDYTIGPGEVVEISVWKNSDLTRVVTVLPSGKISFPLIGDIVASGKTVAQLREELEGKISTFMNEPILSVMVQQVNSLLVYVIGKVNRPGRFVLNNDINVMQALSLAGGLSTYAKRNKIKIFREANGQTTVFDFAYDHVSRGVALEQNITLKRGDVIVIPEEVFRGPEGRSLDDMTAEELSDQVGVPVYVAVVSDDGWRVGKTS